MLAPDPDTGIIGDIYSDSDPNVNFDSVLTGSNNTSTFTVRGVDFEVAYGFDVDQLVDGWGGRIDVRALTTYMDELSVDAPAVARMIELAAQYPRYGYRRIAIFLARDGFPMSFGRAHRLWQAARLQVPRKRPRKRIATGRPRPKAPTGANQVWSYDFVFDGCADGAKLKCLTVTDEWTKEGLAIEVDGRIRSGRVIEVLSRLVSERGAPLYFRSDNGPEFVSHAILKWITDQKIETALIDPGKPWQNGATESFNGKFRDECLRTYGASAPRRAVFDQGAAGLNAGDGRAADHQGAAG